LSAVTPTNLFPICKRFWERPMVGAEGRERLVGQGGGEREGGGEGGESFHGIQNYDEA